jgi:hypothetical protein
MAEAAAERATQPPGEMVVRAVAVGTSPTKPPVQRLMPQKETTGDKEAKIPLLMAVAVEVKEQWGRIPL